MMPTPFKLMSIESEFSQFKVSEHKLDNTYNHRLCDSNLFQYCRSKHQLNMILESFGCVIDLFHIWDDYEYYTKHGFVYKVLNDY